MKMLMVSVVFSLLLVRATAQDSRDSLPRYEMKQYYFVMLLKGENRNQDSATAARIQQGHLDNMERLAKMGKLLVAGPFGDNSDWRGIFIFDCPTKEEVEKYLKEDPAISSGRLSYRIHPWWTAKNAIFK